MPSSKSISLYQFLLWRQFFFSQSSKLLSADSLRSEQRCFYIVTSIRFVSYILTDLRPHGELLTEQTSFLMQPYARFVRIVLGNFKAYFRLPQSRLQASMKRMYTHNTMPFSNNRPLSQLRTNWIRIRWQTWSRLEHKASATRGYNVDVHIKKFRLKFRQISRLTPGTIKKLEFQQEPEDSHPCEINVISTLSNITAVLFFHTMWHTTWCTW